MSGTREKQLVKAGWLTKRGGVVKSWKRRFFLLDGVERSMTYYKSEAREEVTGKIMLEGCSVSNAEERNKKKHCFEVGTAGRTYVLVADSPKEMQDWMDAINTVLRQQPKESGGSGGGGGAGSGAAAAAAGGGSGGGGGGGARPPAQSVGKEACPASPVSAAGALGGVSLAALAQAGQPDRSQRLIVKGMMCEHCAEKIRASLQKVQGVRFVTVTFEEEIVEVVGEVDAELLTLTLEEYGFLVAAP